MDIFCFHSTEDDQQNISELLVEMDFSCVMIMYNCLLTHVDATGLVALWRNHRTTVANARRRHYSTRLLLASLNNAEQFH